MKFNAKYNRYVSKDGLIYRLRKGILKLCKDTYNNCGYVQCSVKGKPAYALVHRIVYETFKGEIPEGYEIDHINSVRDDNRLCNLQILTRVENLKKRNLDKLKENAGKVTTEFGRMFVEHFNTTAKENGSLYHREYCFYKRHNKCSWQLEEI